jgi:hypothetical protein
VRVLVPGRLVDTVIVSGGMTGAGIGIIYVSVFPTQSYEDELHIT